MLKPLCMLAAAAALSGVAVAVPPAPEAGPMDPSRAIATAARAAPGAVPGRFAMDVASTGQANGRTYLNSESDYRDRNNLSIEIFPQTARALAARHGAEPLLFFRGRRVEVRGRVRRVLVIVIVEGSRRRGYYFQTRVAVTSPAQIRIVG